MRIATWEAINPAAPVMRMFLGLYGVAISPVLLLLNSCCKSKVIKEN
uniref:Uncharacterized protein n=1 Tax=Arundo donax TaxID=35708 RepID=A0A0A9HVI2_ARUDO